MNKTSMKHVQQRHFLIKTASRVTEMFPNLLPLYVCLLLAGLPFKTGEQASKQDFC